MLGGLGETRNFQSAYDIVVLFTQIVDRFTNRFLTKAEQQLNMKWSRYMAKQRVEIYSFIVCKNKKRDPK